MPVKHLSALSVLLVMIFLLCMGDTVSQAVLSSMELCVSRVIPSLFPYMVLSSLMISMDLTEPLYRHLPTEKWPGLPRCSASVLLTGFLCGFPVGASGSAALVRDGKLSRADAAKLCAVSSAASPAFVIGTVGSWWTREYGLVLWLTQIACCLGFAALMRKPCPCAKQNAVPAVTEKSLTVCFASAVSSAASSCLSVTASVTFFGSMAQVLSELIPPLAPLFSVVLEFSCGAAAGAGTGGLRGIVITGAAVGFSGVSVMMQNAAFLTPEKISMKPLILSKLSAMIVSAAVSALYFHLRSPQPSGLAANASPFRPGHGLVIIFLLGLLCAAASWVTGKKKHTENT